jgi:hypothetical protein
MAVYLRNATFNTVQRDLFFTPSPPVAATTALFVKLENPTFNESGNLPKAHKLALGVYYILQACTLTTCTLSTSHETL